MTSLSAPTNMWGAYMTWYGEGSNGDNWGINDFKINRSRKFGHAFTTQLVFGEMNIITITGLMKMGIVSFIL